MEIEKKSTQKRRKSIKRENGQGSVYKRSDLKRRPWIAVTPDKAAGRIVLGHYATALEAKKALDTFLNAPTELINLTFGEAVEKWLALHSKDKPAGWKNVMNAAIKKTAPLSGRKLRDLKTDDYQKIIDNCEKLSAGYLNKIKYVLSIANRYGMENDIIQKDYSKFIVMPQHEKKTKQAFNREELEKLKSAYKAGNENAGMILAMCYTGFRITEFMTLTPFSYDKKAKTLRGGMKTDAGRNRLVPVHPFIVPVVTHWIEKGGQFIFNPENDNYIAWREKYFDCTLKDLNIRLLTPHSTRHTAATIFSESGMSAQDIQKILGHASFTMTAETYIHPDAEHLTEAIKAIK